MNVHEGPDGVCLQLRFLNFFISNSGKLFYLTVISFKIKIVLKANGPNDVLGSLQPGGKSLTFLKFYRKLTLTRTMAAWLLRGHMAPKSILRETPFS